MKFDGRLVAMLMLATLGVGIAGAQAPGTFTATGSMATGRAFHTATLLPDGKVLIAGGADYTLLPRPTQITLASSELYDPSTGAFSATGHMTAARTGHSATLLPNGKVLIAGGAESAAEIYDPSTGAFTTAGRMIATRFTHSATLLGDGRVLIAGGSSTSGGALDTAELFDPLTGSFNAVGKMTTGRRGHKAVLLPTGKVLIVPGEEGEDYESAELYDPDTRAFSPTDWKVIDIMVAATANLLTNGSVLVTLNVQECDFYSDTAELYDSSSEKFTTTGSMAYKICRPKGTLLSDGTVLITGGFFNTSTRAQLYDPLSGKFSLTGDMIVGRAAHTMTMLRSGDVLTAGGCNDSCSSRFAYAELYHPPSVKPAPAILTVSGDRPEQGAILRAGSSQVVSPANPAQAGELLEIYCTGLLDQSVIPPQIAIGGRVSEVVFFGNAPGYAGLNQVNVRVPNGIPAGSTVPVTLTYLGRSSNAATIGVK